MTGLTDKAGGAQTPDSSTADSQRAWQEGMQRRVETLRHEIRARSAPRVAALSGAAFEGEGLQLAYWGQTVQISWPGLQAINLTTGAPCPTFDLAMLLYYLHTADGTPLASRWIGFRDLPGGAFYHQAYQGYSGGRVARAFGERPDDFHAACQALGGLRLTDLSDHAYAFQPLPRLPLAAVLWPGDEDFPAQASVLFDAAASHYLVIDGLALLGAGLASRLVHAQPA